MFPFDLIRSELVESEPTTSISPSAGAVEKNNNINNLNGTSSAKSIGPADSELRRNKVFVFFFST